MGECRAGEQTKGLGKQRDAELLSGRFEGLAAHRTPQHTQLCAPAAARALECSKGSPHQSWGENSRAAQEIRQMLMFKALANQMSLPAPRRHSWVPPLEHPCPTRAGGGAHTEPSGSGTPWGHPKVLVTSSAEMPRESGHKSRSFPSVLA